MNYVFLLILVAIDCDEPFIISAHNSQTPDEIYADPMELLIEANSNEDKINDLAPLGDWLEWLGDPTCYNIKDSGHADHPTCIKKMCIKRQFLYFFSKRVFCRKIASEHIEELFYSLPVDMADLFLTKSLIDDKDDPENPEYISEDS